MKKNYQKLNQSHSFNHSLETDAYEQSFNQQSQNQACYVHKQNTQNSIRNKRSKQQIPLDLFSQNGYETQIQNFDSQNQTNRNRIQQKYRTNSVKKNNQKNVQSSKGSLISGIWSKKSHNSILSKKSLPQKTKLKHQRNNLQLILSKNYPHNVMKRVFPQDDLNCQNNAKIQVQQVSIKQKYQNTSKINQNQTHSQFQSNQDIQLFEKLSIKQLQQKWIAKRNNIQLFKKVQWIPRQQYLLVKCLRWVAKKASIKRAIQKADRKIQIEYQKRQHQNQPQLNLFSNLKKNTNQRIFNHERSQNNQIPNKKQLFIQKPHQEPFQQQPSSQSLQQFYQQTLQLKCMLRYRSFLQILAKVNQIKQNYYEHSTILFEMLYQQNQILSQEENKYFQKVVIESFIKLCVHLIEQYGYASKENKQVVKRLFKKQNNWKSDQKKNDKSMNSSQQFYRIEQKQSQICTKYKIVELMTDKTSIQKQSDYQRIMNLFFDNSQY